MPESEEKAAPRNERDFFRLAAIASAISFAALGAVVASWKPADGAEAANSSGFVLSFWTFLAAAVGAVIGWALWRIPRRKLKEGGKPPPS